MANVKQTAFLIKILSKQHFSNNFDPNFSKISDCQLKKTTLILGDTVNFVFHPIRMPNPEVIKSKGMDRIGTDETFV